MTERTTLESTRTRLMKYYSGPVTDDKDCHIAVVLYIESC